MRRINVVGTSGSGKSTFSKELAAVLKSPYLEMDAMFWQPNWQGASDEAFFSILRTQLSQETWVLDGNYNRSLAIKWAKVETVIWLDYSFIRTLYQAVRRAFMRSWLRTELWGKSGNTESFSKSFFSSESVVLWTIKTYASNRARYRKMCFDPAYSHIQFIRLTNPKMARTLLSQLT